LKITCGVALINHLNETLIAHVTNSFDIWSIPKGLVDGNERYIDTAFREFKEETGIDISHLPLYFTGHYKYNNKNKSLIGFYSFLPKGEYIDVSKFKCHSFVKGGFPEVDSFKWLNKNDVNILHHTQQELLKDIGWI